MRKTYKGLIEALQLNQIYVFGSNTQGRHGSGTAKIAYEKYGAIYGRPEGRQGQSYAIITKDLLDPNPTSRTPGQIKVQIAILYEYAVVFSEYEFLIAYQPFGANRCGYSSKELAMFFKETWPEIPKNVVFAEGFLELADKVEI